MRCRLILRSGLVSLVVIGGVACARASYTGPAVDAGSNLITLEATAEACLGGGPCVRDLDCMCRQICRPFANPTNPARLQPVCAAPPNPGGATGGAPCTSNDQCATGQCLGSSGNLWCYSICVSDRDCQSGRKCYPNYVSFTTSPPGAATVTYDSTSACAPDIGSFATCTNDASCPSSEFCAPWPNATKTAWEFHCLRAVGTTAAGAACTADAQCRSGQCLKDGSGNPVGCFGVCAAASDCSTALPMCLPQNIDVQPGVAASAASLKYCQ